MFRDAFYFTKERRGKLDAQDEFPSASISNRDSRQIEHTDPLYVYRRAAYKSSRPINKAFERERLLQHVRDGRSFSFSPLLLPPPSLSLSLCLSLSLSLSLPAKERQERSNSCDGDEKVGRDGMGLKALTAEFNAKLIKSQLVPSREGAARPISCSWRCLHSLLFSTFLYFLFLSSVYLASTHPLSWILGHFRRCYTVSC